MVAARQSKQAHRNISVSVPIDLANLLDAWTAEAKTSRSGVVAQLLAAELQRRDDEELAQAYRDAVAEGFFDDVEFYGPAQAEVALAIPWDGKSEAR